MPFTNKIRLPFYLSRQQILADEEVYLKANGTRRVLKSILSKEYSGKVDWLPAELHERLAVALRHDTVNVFGDKIQAAIRINGSYDIGWIDFLNYPLAPADFKALHEGFIARNTHCGTCEVVVFNSLDAVDDFVPIALHAGVDYRFNVKANDVVCCEGAVFSIDSYDNTLISSYSINPTTGVLDFTIDADAPTTMNAILFTYRVTCGDTSFDTAVVRGNVIAVGDGVCEPPTQVFVEFVIWTDVTPHTLGVLVDWIASVSTPDHYEWELYKKVGADWILNCFGTTNLVHLEIGEHYGIGNLDADSDYKFKIRAVCGVSSPFSIYVTKYFHTPTTFVSEFVMSINLYAYPTVNGGSLDWKVKAQITEPPGVTLTDDIVFSGQLVLSDSGSPADTLVDYMLTLGNGNTSDETAVLATTSLNADVTVLTEEHAPADSIGSDANNYEIIIVI